MKIDKKIDKKRLALLLSSPPPFLTLYGKQGTEMLPTENKQTAANGQNRKNAFFSPFFGGEFLFFSLKEKKNMQMQMIVYPSSFAFA